MGAKGAGVHEVYCGFVSCFGERGVPCVGNGFHFQKTILMNITNIMFEVARFST